MKSSVFIPQFFFQSITAEMYKEVCDENEKLKTEIEKLRKENGKVHETLDEVRKERKKFKQRSDRYFRAIQAMESGKLPRKTKENVVREVLKEKLTPAQLNVWLKNRKTSRSYNWSEEDLAKAGELGAQSKEALNTTRKFLPLPGYSTYQKRFSFISIKPGQN